MDNYPRAQRVGRMKKEVEGRGERVGERERVERKQVQDPRRVMTRYKLAWPIVETRLWEDMAG